MKKRIVEEKKKKRTLRKLFCLAVIFIISGLSAYLYFTFPDFVSLKNITPGRLHSWNTGSRNGKKR